MRRFKQKARVIFVLVLTAFCLYPAIAAAQCDPGVQSCSNSYQVDQTFFGSGGNLESCSNTYCSKQSLGEIAVGETSSNLYRAYAGFNTTDVPFLELFVTAATIDLGVLRTDQANTGVGQFYVRAWQAGGYVVRTESEPPTNRDNGHQIAPMTTTGPSDPGSEQFGINLVENTGVAGSADPEQVPDNTFSFGTAEVGYDTNGQFKYNKGDIVARAAQSTSVTIYKVTYLQNISDVTPSGLYTMQHNLVATATY